MAQWLSWLERRPVTAEVESSSLFWVVMWGLSSAGRASALQAEGHRFEPYRSHFLQKNVEYGEIAQLARARGSYPRCRGFESPSRYFIWDLSSAGRASALQAEGHRFEPCNFHLQQFLVQKCRRGGTGRRAGLKILL